MRAFILISDLLFYLLFICANLFSSIYTKTEYKKKSEKSVQFLLSLANDVRPIPLFLNIFIFDSIPFICAGTPFEILVNMTSWPKQIKSDKKEL